VGLASFEPPWPKAGVVGRTFASIAREFRALPRADRPVSELFRQALRVATAEVPVHGWAALTLDPATLLVTGRAHEHALPTDAVKRLLDLEYGPDDVSKFAALARELTPVSTLSDATGHDLNKSPRYREILAPAGYGPELRAALRSMKHTWGALVLLRRQGSPDFSGDEQAFMREVADSLGEGVRASLRAAGAAAYAAPERAILLFDSKLEIVARSASAEHWLSEVGGDQPRDASGVAHTIRSTVNGARRGAERGTQVSAHVRVRARSGQWLLVHAAALGDGQTVVTIDDGRPLAIAPALLEAYGLSASEGEVLRDVLHGSDDAQIAERLGVPLDAVQTDAANVLQRVGVTSRDELAKKIFFEHYYERQLTGAPLDANGFFRVT
jgi:DNA-binding CsgD family transcriptional regulator